MLIVFYIFLELLLIDLLVAYRFYYRKERSFDTNEEQMNCISTVKYTEYCN